MLQPYETRVSTFLSSAPMNTWIRDLEAMDYVVFDVKTCATPDNALGLTTVIMRKEHR